MRRIALVTLITALSMGQGFAQSTTAHPKAMRAQGVPLDKGPFTADASRAYQGGGVVLEGAPGAPAPMPEATPPGQTPRNMVPPR